MADPQQSRGAGHAAGAIAGGRAAAWSALLLALSPIFELAIRSGSASAFLVVVLAASLGLAAWSGASASAAGAALLGAAVAVLALCGEASFAAVAGLPIAWLAARPERRPQAWLALATAFAAAAALALLGRARSPLDYGASAPYLPATTLESLVRCTGASFTRVAGLEYQLLVPRALDVLPLTLALAWLMARGAARMPAGARCLIVTGALLPFAVAAAMAAVTGHVGPMQADRQLGALPFTALLTGAGLASLGGRPAWLAGLAVVATLGGFLVLALAR